MRFEELNIDELESVDEVLKPYVKQLFYHVIQDKKNYKEEILNKIADDLVSGKFTIYVPRDISDDYVQKNGLSGIDENKYMKEGIIQGNIVIFPAQLKKNKIEILKILSHEFEHYVCQSNENIAKNLDYIKSIGFNTSLIDYDDAKSLPEIGGFCGNLVQFENRF